MNINHVTTESFEFSHGRKPRGRGYWYFHMLGPGRRTELELFLPITKDGRSNLFYTEAKRLALKHANSLAGCSAVRLGP